MSRSLDKRAGAGAGRSRRNNNHCTARASCVIKSIKSNRQKLDYTRRWNAIVHDYAVRGIRLNRRILIGRAFLRFFDFYYAWRIVRARCGHYCGESLAVAPVRVTKQIIVRRVRGPVGREFSFRPNLFSLRRGLFIARRRTRRLFPKTRTAVYGKSRRYCRRVF